MHRSQKRKKGSQVVTVFLALSGSARAKAAHRMLMKLTPGEGCIENKITFFK